MNEAAPRAIAVIGASRDRHKFGNKCVRAYLKAGWRVYPVNPGAEEIEGVPAYPSLAALPDAVDRISVYLPPQATLALLPSLPRQVPIYLNPGSADEEVAARARELGLDTTGDCSIVAIGLSPSQFPA